ncbi:MarR family transcriptional regulator [Thermoflavimicrobium daqui]|uniref:MarR family transcriptional regulator n=2 Tax=Thermoflavimicrobium daqui TaxID=2137476 RepID=A0A364K1D2_9BACL|nr:MarR family transcriptional regulator [Thermoflavimicrobium daqui]
MIAQTYRKLNQLLFLRLKEYEITPEQWSVLYRLSQKDGINQREIAIRTSKDQPTTKRILDCLQKKNLIEKKMSPSDRRAFLIYLTDKGKHLAQQLLPIEQKIMAEISVGMDQAEINQFKNKLLLISENINTLIND